MAEIHDPDEDGSSKLTKIKRYFDPRVSQNWIDAPLYLCCFKTGLLDAAVFNVWSCFVSMQTGNTLYVGLGVSGQPKDQPYRWIKSGTAILAFLIGCYLFSRLQRRLGPKTRKSLVTSTAIQTVLTLLAALLETLGTVPQNAGHILPQNLIVLLPVCLLSLQSAGQIVMSRMLEFPELTTVVLTSAYADMVSDPDFFSWPCGGNSKRNRRLASMMLMIAGAIAGGFMTLDGNIAGVLWLATGIKVVVGIAWLVWCRTSFIRLP